jgi:hypothetical protein
MPICLTMMKLHGETIQSERLKLMQFRNSVCPFYTQYGSKGLKLKQFTARRHNIASNYQLNHFTSACSGQKVYQTMHQRSISFCMAWSQTQRRGTVGAGH